jgi:hypothetical protein
VYSSPVHVLTDVQFPPILGGFEERHLSTETVILSSSPVLLVSIKVLKVPLLVNRTQFVRFSVLLQGVCPDTGIYTGSVPELAAVPDSIICPIFEIAVEFFATSVELVAMSVVFCAILFFRSMWASCLIVLDLLGIVIYK